APTTNHSVVFQIKPAARGLFVLCKKKSFFFLTGLSPRLSLYCSIIMTINVHEANTHFSKLLQRVAAGQEVTIAKAGVPVARLVPLSTAVKPRELGKG